MDECITPNLAQINFNKKSAYQNYKTKKNAGLRKSSKDISLVSVIQDLEEWHRDLNNTKTSGKSIKKSKIRPKSSKKLTRVAKNGRI